MIKEHEKKFLEFLSLKSSYDYDPEFVEIVQTHISIVAIAPPYVYKIKKNIKLDFLDYSSVEKRKLFLEREIQLNRRLCENIYLELVPIYEFEGLLSFEKFYHSSVRIYDNALKMNYLKPEFCLTNILKNALFLDDKMDALIEKLGKFYFTAEQDKVSTEISNHGKPAAVRAMFQNNLLELEKIVSGKYTAVILDALSKFESTYFSRNKRIFEERCESGFIKDGHGDLRLEHIYIQDNNISIYDCIEFNDSFRYIDILNDLAFLMMELDFGGYEEISLRFQTRLFNYFLSHYQTSGGEPVLVYYKIYRALVRAKVNAIVCRESEIPPEKKSLAEKNISDFVHLAFKYALTQDHPAVFVIMGKTASGKSTLAKRIARDSGATALSTDVLRKQLAGVDLYKETPREIKPRVYSPDFSEKVYSELLLQAEKILSEKNFVILDGTFGKKIYRQWVLEKFSKARLLFIEVNSGNPEKKERLEKRELSKSISDARISDKEKIDALYESPGEIDDKMKLILGNSGDMEKVVKTLYEKIMQHSFKKI